MPIGGRESSSVGRLPVEVFLCRGTGRYSFSKTYLTHINAKVSYYLIAFQLLDKGHQFMSQEVLVCRTDALKDRAVCIVEVESIEIGLVRHNGVCYAYRNVCPHQGGPVCEGLRMPQIRDVIDRDGRFLRQIFDESDIHIVCPWHGYEFHLNDGTHVVDKNVRLTRYAVSERDGNIYVTI
jgi:nitrite reductase (NADH) small subunit